MRLFFAMEAGHVHFLLWLRRPSACFFAAPLRRRRRHNKKAVRAKPKKRVPLIWCKVCVSGCEPRSAMFSHLCTLEEAFYGKSSADP